MQTAARRTLSLLQHASKLLVGTGVFSSNEKVDDVNTTDLKYVLTDYYHSVVAAKLVFLGTARHGQVKKAVDRYINA